MSIIINDDSIRYHENVVVNNIVIRRHTKSSFVNLVMDRKRETDKIQKMISAYKYTLLFGFTNYTKPDNTGPAPPKKKRGRERERERERARATASIRPCMKDATIHVLQHTLRNDVHALCTPENNSNTRTKRRIVGPSKRNQSAKHQRQQERYPPLGHSTQEWHTTKGTYP
jgi:hypothetical protein